MPPAQLRASACHVDADATRARLARRPGCQCQCQRGVVSASSTVHSSTHKWKRRKRAGREVAAGSRRLQSVAAGRGTSPGDKRAWDSLRRDSASLPRHRCTLGGGVRVTVADRVT